MKKIIAACSLLIILITSCAQIDGAGYNPKPVLFSWDVGDIGLSAPSVLTTTKTLYSTAVGLSISPSGTLPGDSFVIYNDVFVSRMSGSWIGADYTTEETKTPIQFGKSSTSSSLGARMLIGSKNSNATTAEWSDKNAQFDFSQKKAKIIIDTTGKITFSEGIQPKLIICLNNNTTSSGSSPLGAFSFLKVSITGQEPNTDSTGLALQESANGTEHITDSTPTQYYAIIDPADFSALTTAQKATLKNAFIQIRTSGSSTSGASYGAAILIKSIKIVYMND